MKKTSKNKLKLGQIYYDVNPNEHPNPTAFKYIGNEGDILIMEYVSGNRDDYAKSEDGSKTYFFLYHDNWYEHKGKKTYKNKVHKADFLDWYFNDLSTIGIVDELISVLKSSGRVVFDVHQIFKDCQYIPQHICVDSNGDEEYLSEEVELI